MNSSFLYEPLFEGTCAGTKANLGGPGLRKPDRGSVASRESRRSFPLLWTLAVGLSLFSVALASQAQKRAHHEDPESLRSRATDLPAGERSSSPTPIDDEQTRLGSELAELARRVEDRLERVAGLPFSSQRASGGLGGEVASMRRLLTHLEGRAARLDGEVGRALGHKAASIGRRLANLEVSLRVDATPPWRGEHRIGSPVALGRGVEGGPPTNDACAAAPVVGEGTFLGDTTAATQDGQASCGASLDTADIWFEFVPDSFGSVWIDTVGSAFDAVVSVHQGCPGTLANQLACSDDSIGVQGLVSFFASAGESYWVRVSGYNGATGAVQLNIGRGGSISGTVTRESDGMPIDEGSVCLYDESPYAYSCVGLQSDGSYLLANQSPDTYWAVVSVDDHLDELYDDVSCPEGPWGGSCQRELGTALELGATGDLTGVDFALESGGAIEGVLTDNGTGLPIEGATVKLWVAATDFTSTTSTDVGGVYRFGGLAAGSYRVYTSTSYQDELWNDVPCTGSIYYYSCDPEDGDPIDLSTGQVIGGIDFGLDRLGVVTGTVTDAETGLPISSAEVNLYHVEEGESYDAYTNGSGDFVESGLPSGTYRARAIDYEYISELYDELSCVSSCDLSTQGTDFAVELNTTTSGIDFTLTPKGTIAGTVTQTSDGQPVTYGRVLIYDAGGFVESDYLGSDGTYRVGGLDGGTYFAIAASDDFLDELHQDLPCEDGCDPQGGTPIAVPAAGSATVDFVLDRGGRITGTVTDADTGSAVGQARVHLWTDLGEPLGWVSTGYSSGTYSWNKLIPGTYYVSVSHAGEYLQQIYPALDCQGQVPGDCDPTGGDPIAVTLNTTQAGIDFALARGAGIAGSVRDAVDGSPISFRQITVWNDAGEMVAQRSADYEGNYSVQGLSAGTYTATSSGDSRHVAQLWDGIDCPDGLAACDPTAGTPLVLPADTLVGGIDFLLSSLGTISGTIVSAVDGQPIPYLSVRAYRAPGLGFGSSASTDASGYYRLEGLADGDYYVHTDPYDWVSEAYSDVWCDYISACDLEAATPVGVSVGVETPGIDFELESFARLSGVVRDAAEGLPIQGVEVRVWDSNGSSWRSGTTDVAGRYEVFQLSPGTHYLSTRNSMGYLDQSYVGIPCFGGAPSGCDPTKGAPVDIASGGDVSGFDFELELFANGLLGTVTDDAGQPLAGVAIDAWNEAGLHVASTVTAADGAYRLTLFPGDFYLSTDNGQGLVDEVWNDLSCPGSAFGGGCDPTEGDAVSIGAVGTANAVVTGVDFALRPPTPPFFTDGFESGDTSAWSSVVGEGF